MGEVIALKCLGRLCSFDASATSFVTVTLSWNYISLTPGEDSKSEVAGGLFPLKKKVELNSM